MEVEPESLSSWSDGFEKWSCFFLFFSFLFFCCWDILKHLLKKKCYYDFYVSNVLNKIHGINYSISSPPFPKSEFPFLRIYPRLSFFFFFFHIYRFAYLPLPTVYWWIYLSSDQVRRPFAPFASWSLLSQIISQGFQFILFNLTCILHHVTDISVYHQFWKICLNPFCQSFKKPKKCSGKKKNKANKIVTIYFVSSWNHFCPPNGTPLQYSCLENPMDGGA